MERGNDNSCVYICSHSPTNLTPLQLPGIRPSGGSTGAGAARDRGRSGARRRRPPRPGGCVRRRA